MAEKARDLPGIKMQTPYEVRMTATHSRNDHARWEALFAINAWKPIK